MILLRSVVYFVLMALSVLTHGLAIVLLQAFVSTETCDRIATHWGKVNIWLQRVICGLRIDLVGGENLPCCGAIIMSKHQSTWETIALRGLLAPHQSWVLKQELLNIPIFGRALVAVKAIPIDRKIGRKAVIKVIKEGKKALEADRLVVIFPEGTRTAPGDRGKYGIGGAVLGEKSGFPIIPIAHNAGVYWKRRGVKKYPGTIQVRVGSAIETHGKSAAQIIAEVEDWIENEMKNIDKSITYP